MYYLENLVEEPLHEAGRAGVYEVHAEVQGGVGGDHPTGASGSVPELRRNDDLMDIHIYKYIHYTLQSGRYKIDTCYVIHKYIDGWMDAWM
jgi:hypothetical protein